MADAPNFVPLACGLCEQPLSEGYLCEGCTAASARRLARLPGLYDALAAYLHPSGRRPELGRTRAAEAPLPVAEAPLSLRGPGGIVGVLEDWRAAMQADRGWGPPAVERASVERRVQVAARALGHNLDWIAGQWPAAGQFAAEMRDLERQVLSVVDPPEPTMRLGTCPAEYEDGTVCGAVLRVPRGTATVECRWCGTPYPESTWLSLAALQSSAA
ncbi:hypothetical protein [Streptomyces sp. SCSIO ZS0520]|uniref:hypothetical protein n=1 Tax=Streptomyces sp. SCSIO ZS0520 TaxID=2892996 RepID=UPI0021DB5046|nr:hypothetical protein [Streptomyces sp. SCSIO ZS0520]